MSLDRPVAPDPYQMLPAVPGFQVTSADIAEGAVIDPRFAGNAGNVSPQLSWTGAPAETKSYVVSCFDPDAPTPSGWWHWAIAGIPASASELPTGAGDPDAGTAPDGSIQLRNDAGAIGYTGPYPPPGDRPHRYYYVVHAVDVERLDIDDAASNAVLAFNLAFHTLARAQLVGTYQIAGED